MAQKPVAGGKNVELQVKATIDIKFGLRGTVLAHETLTLMPKNTEKL